MLKSYAGEVTVVPYVGTWIEIAVIQTCKNYGVVVPYVGTWIEIPVSRESVASKARRSLRGNVDRNIATMTSRRFKRCRSLRGNVDRNLWIYRMVVTQWQVVPYVGTWIEIATR